MRERERARERERVRERELERQREGGSEQTEDPIFLDHTVRERPLEHGTALTKEPRMYARGCSQPGASKLGDFREPKKGATVQHPRLLGGFKSNHILGRG